MRDISKEAKRAAANAVRSAKRGDVREYRRQARHFKKANKAFKKMTGFDSGSDLSDNIAFSNDFFAEDEAA